MPAFETIELMEAQLFYIWRQLGYMICLVRRHVEVLRSKCSRAEARLTLSEMMEAGFIGVWSVVSLTLVLRCCCRMAFRFTSHCASHERTQDDVYRALDIPIQLPQSQDRRSFKPSRALTLEPGYQNPAKALTASSTHLMLNCGAAPPLSKDPLMARYAQGSMFERQGGIARFPLSRDVYPGVRDFSSAARHPCPNCGTLCLGDQCQQCHLRRARVCPSCGRSCVGNQCRECHERRSHPCPKCGRDCVGSQCVLCHERQAHSCPKCGRSCVGSQCQACHLAEAHRCPNCGKSCVGRQCRECHISRSHPCPKCGNLCVGRQCRNCHLKQFG